MLVGLGDLGGVLLEFLTRQPEISSILVASRNVKKGQARVHLAQLGAVAQGLNPELRFQPLDLDRPEEVAQCVSETQPDLIVNTATLQAWWWPQSLPPRPARQLQEIGFGVWLPVHLALTQQLMRALRWCGFQGPVVSAPFPDVVNPILGCQGLAPSCGLGNLDEIVAKVKWLAACQSGCRPQQLEITLVAHHALQAFALASRPDRGMMPPFFLRVTQPGDVKSSLDPEKLLRRSLPLPAGRATHYLTAGSAVRLILGLLGRDRVRLHVPGPQGLPGGYPVWVGRGRVVLDTDAGLSREEMIEINQRSHRFDGIERIEEDGAAIFRPEAAERLEALMDYRCDRLAPEDAAGQAAEMMAKFGELARRNGVDLDAPLV